MTDAQIDGSIAIPHDFFADLLPRTRDLAELKLVLHVFHLAHRRNSRSVPLQEIISPAVIRSVVGLLSPEPGDDRLRRALDRAVANGSLLRVMARSGPSAVEYVLPGTAANRTYIESLKVQDENSAAELGIPPDMDVVVYRPNVFSFYERYIGPLTPLVAEQLRDAERSYPPRWIEEAILAAVHYNRRNWRYIESILARWEDTGGPDGITRRSS